MADEGYGLSEHDADRRWLASVAGLVGEQQLSGLLERTLEAVHGIVPGTRAVLDVVASEPGLPTRVDGSLRAGTPRSGAVLRVPVIVRGTVFAHLVLTPDSPGRSFADQDVELVTALAAVAAAGIENLTLHRESRRVRWMALLNEIASSLLVGTHVDEVLALAARGARELAQADLATVCVTQSDPAVFEIRAGDGHGAEQLIGTTVPATGSISADVVRTGTPLVLDDATADPRRSQPMVDAGVFGPAMFVPLSIERQRIGTLAVARFIGKLAFNDVDRWLVESFASQVSVALEYGRAQGELKRLAVTADQERIARDLHDTVIQQLFAIGMSLQVVAGTITDPDISDRLQLAVDDLDSTIRDIRSTVFALQNPAGEGHGLRAQVVTLAAQLCEPYDLDYHVRFEGPVDNAVPSDTAGHVLATLREAVSNVGRHSGASAVQIGLEVGGEVLLWVADDGMGLPARQVRSSGLRNLQKRAESLGGRMRVESRPTGGTLLEWSVPLTRRPPA